VPLFQALSIIANQLDTQTEREVIRFTYAIRVRGGTSLSEALKAYPAYSIASSCTPCRLGEKAGALDSILNYQADLLRIVQRSVVRYGPP